MVRFPQSFKLKNLLKQRLDFLEKNGFQLWSDLLQISS